MNKLLTIDEVAKILAVKHGTIYNLMRDGSLKHLKVRGATRFSHEQIQEYLKSISEG